MDKETRARFESEMLRIKEAIASLKDRRDRKSQDLLILLNLERQELFEALNDLD